jgi:hypothetical protein
MAQCPEPCYDGSNTHLYPMHAPPHAVLILRASLVSFAFSAIIPCAHAATSSSYILIPGVVGSSVQTHGNSANYELRDAGVALTGQPLASPSYQLIPSLGDTWQPTASPAAPSPAPSSPVAAAVTTGHGRAGKATGVARKPSAPAPKSTVSEMRVPPPRPIRMHTPNAPTLTARTTVPQNAQLPATESGPKPRPRTTERSVQLSGPLDAARAPPTERIPSLSAFRAQLLTTVSSVPLRWSLLVLLLVTIAIAVNTFGRRVIQCLAALLGRCRNAPRPRRRRSR